MPEVNPEILIIALLIALFACLRLADKVRRLEDQLDALTVHVHRVEQLAGSRGWPVLQSEFEQLRYWP